MCQVVEAPIFHVNGDDVEGVLRVCRLAVDYRQRFGRDVVVDLVCYRRHGHQEADNPGFTQPATYRKIAEQPSAFDQYADALVTQGVTTALAVGSMRKAVLDVLGGALAEAKAPEKAPDTASESATYLSPDEAKAGGHPARSRPVVSEPRFTAEAEVAGQQPEGEVEGEAEGEAAQEEAVALRDDATGVARAALHAAGVACTSLPAELEAHRVVRAVYKQRKSMLESGEGVDWATAEALACATLLADGVNVRFSGQDVERGTFSQRHAVVHDQARGLDCNFEHR